MDTTPLRTMDVIDTQPLWGLGLMYFVAQPPRPFMPGDKVVRRGKIKEVKAVAYGVRPGCQGIILDSLRSRT